MFTGTLELPLQEGTLVKGMAVGLGPSDVAFAPESSQLSHILSFLA